MMWKKLIAGILSASVVCASLTAVALNLGLNRAVGDAPDAMLYEQRYEAEDAQPFGGAGKATDHTGYTGSGFMAGLDQDGRGLTFTVTVPRADRYMIGIRYACTNSATTLSMYTGEDVEQAQKVSFSKVKDNNWDNWNTTYAAIPLEAGENQLSFQRVAGVNGGAINMDSITVTDAVVYEAEDATFLPENWGMATGHVGYSGRGFMEGWGTDGRSMTFTVNAARDGVYTVALRYQSAQGDTRTLNVYVNDETDARTAEFPRNNGGWEHDVWSNTYMNLPLKAGENTIKIAKEADVNGNINIDSLIVPNRLLTASEVAGGVQNGNFENDYEGWTLDDPDNTCSGINGANNVVGKNLYMWSGSAFQQGVSQELTGLENGWYALSYWKQNNANAPKSQTNELLAGAGGVSASFAIPYSTGGFWYPMSMAAKPGADGKLNIHIATDANAGASTMIAKFRLWKLVDKSALYDQIASGKDLLEADYSAETWQAYQTALSAAREALQNGDSQPAVDAAAAALAEKQSELAAPPPPVQYAPSSLVTEQKYEAEDGQIIGGAEVQQDHGGYTGRGFVAQTDQTDQPRGTAITVNVPRAGSYTVGIRFAAGSNATMGVYANDSADVKTVDLFRTKDSWESWGISYVNLALEEGENTITILRRKGANPDKNAANIDYITLTDATVYEAEDAEIIPAHRDPATDHTGCSGRGFMAGLGDKGRGMVFTVDAQRDGLYTLAFRYQSAHGSTRTMHAYANDGAAATVSFPKNNRDWGDDYWSFAYVDLELKAGENAVKLVNDEGVDGDINVDCLLVPNRLVTAAAVQDVIQNPKFADGLDGWQIDDAGASNYAAAGDDGLAGSTIFKMTSSASDFEQGIGQQLTGLDNGWYAVSFYMLNGSARPNSVVYSLTAGQGEDSAVTTVQLPTTTMNVWMVQTAAAQVVDGNLQLHIQASVPKDAYLQMSDFRLWKILDKSALYDQIASGADLAEAEYTTESWRDYQTALTAADAALSSAANQQAVDSAKTDLKTAQDALVSLVKKYDVTLQKPADLEVNVTPVKAAEGATVTVVLGSMPAGKVLDAVSVKDADNGDVAVQVEEDGSYTFTMPAKAVTVTVTLKAAVYTVTASAGENGTITPASQVVEHGQNAVFTLAPAPSYHVGTVTVAPDTDYEIEGNTLTVQNITATTSVSVAFAADAAPAIKSVAAIPNQTVANGTAYADLELPAKVEVTLDDDTKAEASIAWDKGDYDGSKAGEYTLTGTLTLADVENPKNLTASIKVTVQPAMALTIKSVAAIAGKTVANGTVYADLELPAKVEVTLSDNTKAEASIAWAKGDYDGSKAGEYTLIGVLTLADVENPENLTASIKITVKEEGVAVYIVTAQAGDNGAVAPATLQVESGEDAVFVITPAGGYEVDAISVEPEAKYVYADGKLTLSAIEADTAVKITFKAVEKPLPEDKVQLNKNVSEARVLLENAVIGEMAGQYPEAAVAAFQAAVEAAQAVLNNADATQADIAAAIESLSAAQRTFAASQITEPAGGDDSDATNTTDTSAPSSDQTSSDQTSSSTGGSDKTQNGSNNPKTSNALPALAVATLSVSGAAILLVERKRRRSK